jgi:hypothetical protein
MKSFINYKRCTLRKKMMSTFAASLLLLFYISGYLSGASVPEKITYQGYIMQNGIPANGNVDFTFDILANGNPTEIWSSAQTLPVNNGSYTAILSVSKGLLHPYSNYQLRVKVYGTALNSNVTLNSVPFAYYAGAVNFGNVMNNPWVSNGAGTVYTTGNVGIGTSSVSGRLDVRGDEVRIWTGAGAVNLATGSGDLYVQNELEVDGTFYNYGNVRIWDGTANVDYANGTRELYVEYDLEVDGNFYNQGNARILDGSDTINYASGVGDLYVGSDLEVDGLLYVASTATFSGTTYLQGHVRVWDGSASVNYATGIRDLYVESDLEVDGALYVLGSTTLSGTVNLNGTTYFNSTAYFYGNARVWDGSATVNYATGIRDLYVESDLEVDGGLYALGTTYLFGNVRIWDGVANVNYATGTRELYVEYDLEVDGNFYNQGNARILDGSDTINYASGIGDLYVGSDLEVDGYVYASTFGSAATFTSSASFNSSVTVGGTFTANASSYFNGYWSLTRSTASFPAMYVVNSYNGTAADGIRITIGSTTVVPGSGNYFLDFRGNYGGARGRVSGTATGVSYVTTSDERLKQNIEDLTGALDMLKSIKPRTFEFKLTPGERYIGFIAQELDDVLPEIVNGNPDDDVEEEPMMVDYGRITPLLTAAIKEQQTIIEDLKARIEVLESK